MERPWNAHGTPMEHPWNAHETPMERPRNAHGTPIEHPWNASICDLQTGIHVTAIIQSWCLSS